MPDHPLLPLPPTPPPTLPPRGGRLVGCLAVVAAVVAGGRAPRAARKNNTTTRSALFVGSTQNNNSESSSHRAALDAQRARIMRALEAAREVRAAARAECAKEKAPSGKNGFDFRAADSNNALTLQETTRPRLGICVTGQTSRLELASKVRHVVAANAERYLVDVVLVVGPGGDAQFVNDDTDAGGRLNWTKRGIEDFVRDNKNSDEDVVVVVDDAPQETDPYVDATYLTGSDKPTLGERRVHSHVRQWLALLDCYRHFAIAEALARGCDAGPYDVLLKLRDDSYVLRDWPLDSPRLTSLFPRHEKQERLATSSSSFGEDDEDDEDVGVVGGGRGGVVVVPDCLGFGGVNDKVGLLDARAAKAFFAMPAYEYYFNFSALGVGLKNPETVLRRVLEKHGVAVKAAAPDDVPVATSRVLKDAAPTLTTSSASTSDDDDPDLASVVAANRSCFLFDALKLGNRPRCWPSDCATRQRIFCDRCRGVKEQRTFREPFLTRSPIPTKNAPPPPPGDPACRPPPECLRRRRRRR